MIVKREYNISEVTIKDLIQEVNEYWETEDPASVLKASMPIEEIIASCEGFAMEDCYNQLQESFYLEDLDNHSRIAIAKEVKRLLQNK